MPAFSRARTADDDRGQQVEARDAVVLTFAGAVAQFAALVEVDGTFHGGVGFSFVQTALGAPTHGGVGDAKSDFGRPYGPANRLP